MATIRLERGREHGILRVTGELDGSTAWRVVRLVRRFGRERIIYLDLGGVERLLSFGASVLAQGLAGTTARLVAVRPEHRRMLASEGLVAVAQPIAVLDADALVVADVAPGSRELRVVAVDDSDSAFLDPEAATALPG